MIKFLIKIMSVVLSILFLVSATACGCESGGNENNNNNSNINNNNNSNINDNPNKPVIVYSDGMLFSNGRSDYKLVVPTDKTNKEELAVTEFNEIFKLSSGFELNVVEEGTDEYTDNDKIISIGATKVAKKLGVVPSYDELGSQGYIAKTIKNAVIINGADRFGYGTLYGVYDFLAQQVGFECYAEDETYVDVYKEVKLVNINLKDKPDIPLNVSHFKIYKLNATYRFRQRYVQSSEIFVGGMSMYHTSFTFLPPDTYKEEHPKWYSPKGNQLCFNARGDEKEREIMIDTIFNTYLEAVLSFENIEQIGLGIMDNLDFCDCSACSSDLAKYGANSASQIKFMNAISDKFAKYFEENNIDRHLQFEFFAYKPTFAAPTKNLEEVQCNENVYPFICTFWTDRAAPINDQTNNKATYDAVEAWSKVAKHMSFWQYSANYANFLLPHDPFSRLQPDYQYVASKDPIYYYGELIDGSYTFTNFYNLYNFLSYKLAWDVNYNFDSLVNEFFIHYFKDAAEPMLEFFTRFRLALEKAHADYGYNQIDAATMNKEIQIDCFSHGELKTWRSLIDKALDAIEYLKDSNPNEYTKLYKRIILESIVVDFNILNFWKAYYSDFEISQMKEELKKNCKLTIVEYYNSNGNVIGMDSAIDML